MDVPSGSVKINTIAAKRSGLDQYRNPEFVKKLAGGDDMRRLFPTSRKEDLTISSNSWVSGSFPYPEDGVVAGVSQVSCQIVNGTNSGVHSLEEEAQHCKETASQHSRDQDSCSQAHYVGHCKQTSSARACMQYVVEKPWKKDEEVELLTCEHSESGVLDLPQLHVCHLQKKDESLNSNCKLAQGSFEGAPCRY